MNDRVVTGEDFEILKKLEDYKYRRAYPDEDSFATMIEQVHNLIEKLYEYEDYRRKIEFGPSRKPQVSTVVVMDEKGNIWKSDDTPVGMETEAIVRLLNSSEAHDRRDFYRLPVHIKVSEIRMPDKDAVLAPAAHTSLSFRKVEKISYRG